MKNGVFSTLELYAYRLHKSLASCLTIARIYINMLAPQTLRTVISVTTPAHKETTLFTSEIFFSALEFFRIHHSILHPLCLILFSCQRTVLCFHHTRPKNLVKTGGYGQAF